jgi:NADH:ubiquinone reductase (H+-translocating)
MHWQQPDASYGWAVGTIFWCGGLRGHDFRAQFAVLRDRFGRLPVDEHLKVKGLDAEFAAGDAAWFHVDGTHVSVMSCQHARPMGRFVGHNVACNLPGEPMLPLRIDWYVTVLDLGAWGVASSRLPPKDYRSALGQLPLQALCQH